MTCGRATARDMARVVVRRRLTAPRTLLALVVVAVVGGLPLALAGYPVGGLVEGGAGLVVVTVVLAATSYRRARASATTLCPPGATLELELDDDLLRLRNGAGAQETPYTAFAGVRRVGGHVLLPLRLVRAHVTLPPGLLSEEDVEWLAARIARTPPPDAPAPVAAPETAAGDGDPAWPHEVQVNDGLRRRLTRAVVGYRLRGRGAVVRAALAVAVLAWTWVVTGRWLVAVATALLVTAALVLVVVVGSTRALRRQTAAHTTIRARFDATHLHLDGGGAHGSLAYSALRRCVERDGAVLLLTRTGLLQVLPREVVPDDALARIRAVLAAARS